MATILMMSAKMVALGLRKVKAFWKVGHGIIISVNVVTNKTLSRNSNDIVVVVMSKLNNLGLTLSTNLKLYSSVANGLRLKVRMFLELIPTFVEVAGEIVNALY